MHQPASEQQPVHNQGVTPTKQHGSSLRTVSLTSIISLSLALWLGSWAFPLQAQPLSPRLETPPTQQPLQQQSQEPPQLPLRPLTPPPDAASAAATNPDNVLIILDASSSMEEKLPTGETKMVAAKRAILEVLKMVPPHVKVGLRIYGESANAFTACHATRTLVPLGVNNRGMIANKLVAVRPVGPTPITWALNRAVREDFANATGSKAIILVSDGQETCDGDPCDLAVSMVRNGVNIKIDVVGFGLYDLSAIRQLKCIALSTYGKFYQADTAAALAQSMHQSMQAKTDVHAQVLIPGGRNRPSIAGPQFAPNGLLYQNQQQP